MEVLTVEQISEKFEVHPETIRRALKSGELKGFKLGKGWRVYQDDLNNYIELKNKEVVK